MEQLKKAIENHFENNIKTKNLQLERKNERDFHHREHIIEIHHPSNQHSVYICYTPEDRQLEVWRGIDKSYHEDDYYPISEFDKCLSDLEEYLNIA